MVDSLQRYRRVSVTQHDGKPIKYDARVDVEADTATGVVTYKVYSRVLTNRFMSFRSSGNAAEDTVHLERVCQRVYEFDQGYRVRAVPKPTSSSSTSPKMMFDRCPRCGGDGWIEDETGYPVVCACRD